MTISESNPTFMNTASALLTNSNEYQSTNMAFQDINGLTNLGETFSNIFTEAQKVNTSLSKQNTATIVNKDNSVDLMQQNLFSALGLGILSSGTGQSTLDLLTSQSSIETMQASVLSALQASLFSAQPTTSNSTNSENVTTNVFEAETTNESIASNLAQFSFGEDGIDLKDGFDVFNIMQHIPIVSSVYQEVSGQDISAISKLFGGYFYGGMFGLAFSALDLAIESYSGSSLNDTLAKYDYTSIFNRGSIENSDGNVAQDGEVKQVLQSTFR